jgi:hypothetical protein
MTGTTPHLPFYFVKNPPFFEGAKCLEQVPSLAMTGGAQLRHDALDMSQG